MGEHLQLGRLRFAVAPGDVPPIAAARRLGLTLEEFKDRLPELRERGFPLPDKTTGHFDLDAIDVWFVLPGLDVGDLCLSPRPLTKRELIDGITHGKARRIEGNVYVVGFAGYVKIGFTIHAIEHRIAQLQTACPEKLETHASFASNLAFERELHGRFADLRLQGEWFRREAALAAWIDAGCPR